MKGITLLLIFALLIPPFWEGEVTLVKDTTFEVVANSGKTYEISCTTALGALHFAAEKGGFSYSVSDEWYEQYGSLFIVSIAGVENKGMEGWQYWVNYPDEPLPWVGADKYQLKDGDTVDFFYGSFGCTPDDASMLIRIHVNIIEDKTPPMVEIIKPRGGIYLFDREILHFSGISIIFGSITIEAEAIDNLSKISKLEFYIDDHLMYTDIEEPYEWRWNGERGWHVIEVKAYDEVGNYGYKERVVIVI